MAGIRPCTMSNMAGGRKSHPVTLRRTVSTIVVRPMALCHLKNQRIVPPSRCLVTRGSNQYTAPVIHKKSKTSAIASIISLPARPKSSPLCSHHTVRNNDTLPSLSGDAAGSTELKRIYGGRERYTRERPVTTKVSPLVEISLKRSPSVNGTGNTCQALSVPYA